SVTPHPGGVGWAHIAVSEMAVGTQYLVQRSQDLNNWSPITTISSSMGSMSFDDSTVGPAAIALYRLVTSSSAPAPQPGFEIWIAMRADALPGSGTQSDPYDGSTAAKFDALLF